MEQIKFSYKNSILIPILFVINMIEVVFFAKNFLLLYEKADFTYTTFSIAIVLLSIFVIALYRFFEKYKGGNYYLHYNTGLIFFMLLLTLVCYIGGMIYFKQYIPGAVSGIALIIPLSIYLLRALKKMKVLTRSNIFKIFIFMILIIALTALALFIGTLFNHILYKPGI